MFSHTKARTPTEPFRAANPNTLCISQEKEQRAREDKRETESEMPESRGKVVDRKVPDYKGKAVDQMTVDQMTVARIFPRLLILPRLFILMINFISRLRTHALVAY